MNRLEAIFNNADFASDDKRVRTAGRSSKVNYFIAFTPRSGSSWLTELLSNTNRLGRPGEWFNLDNLPDILKNFPPCDIVQYVDLIRRIRRTPNDVFGFEASFFQINLVEAILPLKDLFGPDLIYIYLTREDFVLQAVSLYRAISTGYFHSPQGLDGDREAKVADLPYDADRIQEQCRHIVHQEFGFERLFLRHRAEPLRITYEELSADPVVCVSKIADHVGAQGISGDPTTADHKKVGGSVNDDWARRFRDEQSEFVQYWEQHRGKKNPAAPG